MEMVDPMLQRGGDPPSLPKKEVLVAFHVALA
jgi:hypothetical protein